MRNIKLILSYDGTDFNGWQTQPGFRTVQETLEGAIASPHRRAACSVNASGRTDAGVHAVGQVVNFYTASPSSAGRLRPRRQRPPAGRRGRPRRGETCRRRSTPTGCERKLYRYVIHDGPVPDLFLRRYCLPRQASARCRGDGAGRRGLWAGTTSTASRPNGPTGIPACARSRTLAVNRLGDWIWLDVEADGFLYNMVRAIAGTLINVGRGYWPEGRVERRSSRAEDRRGRANRAGRRGCS